MASEDLLKEMTRLQDTISKIKQDIETLQDQIRAKQVFLDICESNYENVERAHRNLTAGNERNSKERRNSPVAQILKSPVTTDTGSEPTALNKLAVQTIEKETPPQVRPKSSSKTPVEVSSSRATLTGKLPHGSETKDISLFSLLKLHTVKTRLQDVEERLEMGADIHEKDHRGGTPLHLAIAYKLGVEIIKLLLDRGANPNTVINGSGETPLHLAVLQNQVPVVELLLSHGADPNLADERGNTPICYIGENNVIYDVLIKAGAKPPLQESPLSRTPQSSFGTDKTYTAEDIQSVAGALGSLRTTTTSQTKSTAAATATDAVQIKELEEEQSKDDEEGGESAQASKRIKREGDGEVGRRENKHLEQVREFLDTNKEQIQNIFKNYTRQYENNPIECGKTDKGNYKITPEQRRQYSLPRGIQGTQARHGQQNFNILLHNVVLSGVKLGLQGEYVNFVDPRDAAEVLKQVQAEYDMFY